MIKAERLVGAVSLFGVLCVGSFHGMQKGLPQLEERVQAVHRHQGSQFVMGAGEAWVREH